MDQESKKRGREEEQQEEETNPSSSSSNIKKQELISNHQIQEDILTNNNNSSSKIYENEHPETNCCMSSSGVFDFPWLKEGEISKWDIDNNNEWFFEHDSFVSSLNETYTSCLDTAATTTSFDLSKPCLCKSSSCTHLDSFDSEFNSFEENLWSLELEGTWTSLLSQPIQQDDA